MNPKSGHSMAATKEFVFITGGKYEEDGKTFEILSLAYNSLFRGPDLEHSRNFHCSLILDEYLYVVFGSKVSSEDKSISFERIKIPQPGMKITLQRFYQTRKWEYSEIKNYSANLSSFKANNWFKTYDSRIICFGTVKNSVEERDAILVEINADKNLAKLSLKISRLNLPTNELFEMERYQIGFRKNDRLLRWKRMQVFEESINYPFMERGDIYMPIFQWHSNESLAKWDSQIKKFTFSC
jgi:hypothetical protein